ncbi:MULTISPECIES: NAD-dependent epimerase/dehydratase family protein [unclassified Pseudomonas]|uniref:NAD-dependent epimerase/dehydratase family protein n=1 Tax=unclassified Pseudomonas TaxID=196821 RepID=UPI001199B828|nr:MULTISPECIES: NAD-dependent epimerase/dehydratase family protein [unclassified Pseudomonas]TWC15484.1 dihydroflavonol-4-reductase [Pseudomonas sp. SJZ075]TWC19096.1 dihydroflavonol-4-reductase [Pseudomonas sp. SJZ074]TWC30438.1 dihydroflavonol-4-reductase [Pseudomonas sp. SJZ078]TWC36888.1 dihydroflavonol-4-reductase [Pseudomonas sp. SJZ085]TWC53161.1 dihydroflavonol-4-reductase [Pseudomonas sp. SJZ124]
MILVTGASGCLGSHIVRWLLEQGETVAVLVLPKDPAPALAGLRERLDWREGDLLVPASLAPALRGVTRIYHAAGLALPYESERQRMFAVNVQGTVNLLQAARAAGVGRILHVSSIAAVGYPARQADETMAYNGDAFRLAYMHSKREAEEQVRRFCAEGMDIVIACPSAVIASHCDVLHGWGKVMLDLRYRRLPFIPPGGIAVIGARDLVQGLQAVMDRGQRGERYILSAHNISYRELFGCMADALSVKAPRWRPRTLAWIVALLRPLDLLIGWVPLRLSADVVALLGRQVHYRTEKARQQLGFVPRQSLEDLVHETAHWLIRLQERKR